MVLTHEEDCPFRDIKCVVLNCYKDMKFNGLEDHMAELHEDMMAGEWVIQKRGPTGAPIVANGETYAMRTWRDSGNNRHFATLVISIANNHYFWNIWITAACGKTSAEQFRAVWFSVWLQISKLNSLCKFSPVRFSSQFFTCLLAHPTT